MPAIEMLKALLSRLFTSRKKATTRANKQRLHEAYEMFRELEREAMLSNDKWLIRCTWAVTTAFREELSSIPDLDWLPDGWYKFLDKEKLSDEINRHCEHQKLLDDFKKANQQPVNISSQEQAEIHWLFQRKRKQ